jgi:hypothetical protein
MSNGTKVVKRNGAVEPLDLDKMHLMVEEACGGLAGVSASQVEMTSGIQFYDGISTEEIQETLIRSASDLIDLDIQTINLLLLVFFYLPFANNFMEDEGTSSSGTAHLSVC